MIRTVWTILVLAIALPVGSACGGDDDGGDGGDDGSTVDGGSVDAASDGCEQAELLPTQFRPIAVVSEGLLTTAAGEGATEAVIDASAGGLDGAADNPYLYVDLEAGTKVEIDDVDALSSTEWDVAFKRSSIRVNGGDSGPAGAAAAVVAAASLADVTEAPADSEFSTDDWSTEDCAAVLLPGGEPQTAFGEWYDYDANTHVLTPKAEIHAVRTRSGDLVKMAIESYYGDQENPMRGGVYRVAWAPL